MCERLAAGVIPLVSRYLHVSKPLLLLLPVAVLYVHAM